MTLTPFDWHSLYEMFSTYSLKHGSCHLNKETNCIDCHLPKGLNVQFPLKTINLEKDIINSLPIQFALFYSITRNSINQVVTPEMVKDDEFQKLISILLICYSHVHPYFKDGYLYSININGITMMAKNLFQRLFISRKLHPCIEFLSSRTRCTVQDTEKTVYEIKDFSYKLISPSADLITFTEFLKTRKHFLKNVISFPCYGFTFSDLSKSSIIQYIISQFSRSFYIEESNTKISCGFYLM